MTTHQIDLNRRIVNFGYWRTRAEAELTDEAPKAHSATYDADKMAASGENLAKARSLYESAWKLYAVVFKKYAELMDNAEAQDLVESIAHYRDVLGQLDEPFPADFPLWDLLDKHYKGQQIRDQVKVLQGRDATEQKKEGDAKKDEGEAKADAAKTEDTKAQATKKEDTQADDSKKEETKSVETKTGETGTDKTKADQKPAAAKSESN
jgi:hypothetical protein